MGELYGVEKSIILKYAKKIGYDNHTPLKLSEQDIQDIIDNYENTDSVTLANKYGIHRCYITKIWHDHNCKGKIKNRRIYDLDESYFDNIDTPDKAYFLGWIASDGCISNNANKKNTLSISLKGNDAYILHLFSYYLSGKSNNRKPLSYRSVKHSKGTSIMARFEISSDKIFDALNQYEIVPNKSKILEICTLPEPLMAHYLRGYFDGDGSLTVRYPLSRSNLSYTGFIHNMKCIQEYLQNFQNISMHLKYDKRDYGLPFGGLRTTKLSETYKFLKYLYKDYENLCLIRKQMLANQFITEYELKYK